MDAGDWPDRRPCGARRLPAVVQQVRSMRREVLDIADRPARPADPADDPEWDPGGYSR